MKPVEWFDCPKCSRKVDNKTLHTGVCPKCSEFIPECDLHIFPNSGHKRQVYSKGNGCATNLVLAAGVLSFMWLISYFLERWLKS